MTYLELSEDGGGSHKFYEVTVAGTQVTITYGRIGEAGQTKVSSFPTAAKAQEAADKKVGEKTRKGYTPAVRGGRARRTVTRRSIPSRPSTPSPSSTSTTSRSVPRQPPEQLAPVLWRFNSGSAAFGIFVDEERCWVGNQDGDVYTVSHGGTVNGRFRLPDGVKCIVADDFWIYAGCDDGRVYDLSGKVPRSAYEIAADVDIYWLDIHDGVLGVSDRAGRVTAIDYEDEAQWSRSGTGDSAWMVRCDQDAVYHGHSRGVAAHDLLDGALLWQHDLHEQVLFGWQEEHSVYAGTARGARGSVHRLAKRDGRTEAVYQCDGAVYSCATSPGGRHVFAGDDRGSVYCFDASGARLWKLSTGCGSAFSMQFLNDRLYIVTTNGALACIDAGEAAIAAARAGNVPQPLDVKAAASLRVVEPSVVLETTSDVGNGVVVECVKEGERLRVRVVSPGYETWNVQFPKDIREAGARYLVDGLRSAGRGGFYRAYGEIKRLL